MPTVLLADDDASIRTVLERALSRSGYGVMTASDGAQLMAWARAGHGQAVITDVMMPLGAPLGGKSRTGLDLLPVLKQERPDLPVIVISARSTLMTAVKAAEGGAFDYLPKPFDLDQLMACVARAIGDAAPAVRQEKSEAVLSHPSLLGLSPAMQQLYRTLARLVSVDLTVTVEGESGTGKELVARALHDLSPRRGKPFIAVNMAAIPRELVESELFGHEKGAFTGAVARKAGTFAQAAGGTVFLDEIGDMPMEAQTRLLRVLQQGEFTPVGSSGAVKADARVICATHRDLREHAARGAFREDLYYRLNVVPLRVPPLRERREDIPLLAAHFLERAAARGLPFKTFDDEALQALQEHDWPGNVRELENMAYRLSALAPEQVLSAAQVRAHLPAGQAPAAPSSLEESVAGHLQRYFAAHAGGLPPSGLHARVLECVERPLIASALKVSEGNQLKAAHLLGINRNTLRKKMRELGIMSGKPA